MQPTENIKTEFFSGVLWNGISQIGGQGIQFITTLILARLLTPEDFGVVAMANSFTLLVGIINQLGISPSIIKKKNITGSHLTSAYWANILAGIILCLSTIVVSGLVADFFDNRKVQPVLNVLSFMFLLGAVKNVNTALIVKELRFRKLSYIHLTDMVSNGIVAIILANLNYGVWSIVAGRLVGLFMGTIVTFYISKWRPSFFFNVKAFKELFSFGIQAMGASILGYFIVTLDNIIVGRYLGATALGFYSIAYNMVTLPQRKITSVVSGVAFPAFSSIQDEPERIIKGYIKILNMLSFVIFPMLGGLFSVAPEFILCVLGEKWANAIIPLQILCLVGIMKSVDATAGSIFYSHGRPDLELKLGIIYFILLLIGLMIGKNWALKGIAFTLCIIGFFMQIFYFFEVSKLTRCRIVTIYKPLIRNFIMMLIMVVIIFQFKIFIISYGLDQLLVLSSTIIFGINLYLLIAFIGNREMLKELNEITGFLTHIKKLKSLLVL